MSGIEALYIFDGHNTLVLQHTFQSRPPPPSTLLPLYLSHPTPRPSVIYLPSLNPQTILFSIQRDALLFLSPVSTDTEPLLVLEYLSRVYDALVEFLGTPLLASRIEANYDVVSQLLLETCDSGLICSTEANALRDVVETPSFLNKLVGGLGLPGSAPTLTSPNIPGASFGAGSAGPALSVQGSSIPWRRANVRHTHNEMYVDIVETLSVTFAPSGRPLAAFARGSIAFTSKVSGVPDLLLSLTTTSAGGSGDRGAKVRRTMERPVFHPCVRLARWKERGELSFVPPDGRFVLAGYEADLLDSTSTDVLSADRRDVNLPASVEMKTGLGSAGNEFEVRLVVNPKFSGPGSGFGGSGSGSAAQNLSSNLGRPPSSRGPLSAGGNTSEAKIPLIEDLCVSIPIPTGVRNITDLRPSKGEAHWSPGDAAIEWRIGAKEAGALGSGGAVLKCTLVGQTTDEDQEGGLFGSTVNGTVTDTYDYDEGDANGYKAAGDNEATAPTSVSGVKDKIAQNAALMPTSANLSFSVKGWLASGLRVDSLTIDARRSKGLGEGVKPYKGVKYLTASRGGIEVRC